MSGLSRRLPCRDCGSVGWRRTTATFLRGAAFKDYTTICNSAPSEVLGIMALRSRERIIARNLAIIRANLALAEQFFAARGGVFRWLPPKAGSVAFPQLVGTNSAADFCRDVLDAKSLMILPGDVFDFGGNHFRIGLGRRNFEEALGVLGKHLTVAG